MYILKGFCKIPTLVDNIPGNVKPIGELTSYSASFSRKKGFYAYSDLSKVVPITFHSFDAITGQIEPPANVVGLFNRILDWIASQIINDDIGTDGNILRNRLGSIFGAEAVDFDVGDIYTHDGIHAPEWVSWSLAEDTSSTTKFWFTDDAFRSQYDEYEVVPLTPLPEMDDLYDTKVEVERKFAEQTLTDIMERVEVAKDGVPETILTTAVYKWYEPDIPDNRMDVTWTVLVYGPAGNNPEAIKEAILEHSLANSAYDRFTWGTVIPEVFNPTEFYLVPAWDEIPNSGGTLIPSLYRSAVKVKAISNMTEEFIPGYDPDFIAMNVVLSGSLYKSVSFLAIGNVNNLDGIFTFDAKFPDYALIPSTSLDYVRISPETQGWINAFHNALDWAERYELDVVLPKHIILVIRDDKYYLSFKYGNTDYLVLTKWSYMNV